MYQDKIVDFLNNYGVPNGFSNILASGLILISIVVIVLIINFIGRRIILSFFKRIAKSTTTPFDDLLVKNKIPRLLSFVPSLFFLFWVIPIYNGDLLIMLEALTIILFIVTVKSVLGTVKDYFKLSSSLKHIPIDSYIQVVMLFL